MDVLFVYKHWLVKALPNVPGFYFQIVTTYNRISLRM